MVNRKNGSTTLLQNSASDGSKRRMWASRPALAIDTFSRCEYEEHVNLLLESGAVHHRAFVSVLNDQACAIGHQKLAQAVHTHVTMQKFHSTLYRLRVWLCSHGSNCGKLFGAGVDDVGDDDEMLE